MILEYIIVGLFIALIVAVFIWLWINEKQVLINWLVKATAEAETTLGSGTGQLKLLYVYDLFISKFKIISRFVSFEMFSKLVDIALNIMEDMLENNEKIKMCVIGEYENETKDKILNE